MKDTSPTIRWTAQAGGVTAELAALNGYDLSVMRIGEDRVSWLVRRDGRDMAEGVERTPTAAKDAAARRAAEQGQ
jgi:hypothetical protein